jgi:hypothetical protein
MKINGTLHDGQGPTPSTIGVRCGWGNTVRETMMEALSVPFITEPIRELEHP